MHFSRLGAERIESMGWTEWALLPYAYIGSPPLTYTWGVVSFTYTYMGLRLLIQGCVGSGPLSSFLSTITYISSPPIPPMGK